METLINYLTDMLTHDKEVVSVSFVLEQLKDIREDQRQTRYEDDYGNTRCRKCGSKVEGGYCNCRQTRYEPAYEVFKRKQDECIIQDGWRVREAARGMRLYEGGK